MNSNYNMFSSSRSSGCESGWTFYLENSLFSSLPSHGCTGDKRYPPVDEEEDSSMVSDASSGPPIIHEEENYGNSNNRFSSYAATDAALLENRGKRKKTREKQRPKAQDHPSFLDDTASSPVFNFSQNNFTRPTNQASTGNILDYSYACPSTHLKGESTFHEHFNVHLPLPGSQMQPNHDLALQVVRREEGDEIMLSY
ncbi:hypothetical protein NMG60_11019798 [Bertholletia excelsa]